MYSQTLKTPFKTSSSMNRSNFRYIDGWVDKRMGWSAYSSGVDPGVGLLAL